MAKKTLNLEECKVYVKSILDLELSCYQQEKLLRELKNKPVKMQQEIVVLEDEKAKEKPPAKPMSKGGATVLGAIVTIVLDLFFALFGAVIGGVGGLAVRLIAGIIGDPSSWLIYIAWGAGIGYAIGLACMFYWTRNTVKESAEDVERYPERLKDYEKSQQNKQEIIDRKKETLANWPSVVAKSEAEYQQTKEILKQYYSLGFIYPKYRGLVPISSLWEYLESGRCFTLLGPDGAYNLYESELRSNLILSKLDDILDRLDDLSAGQRALAAAITESNRKISELSRSLDRIEDNTAVSAYYNRVTAVNTDYMAWLAAFQ